MQMENEKKRAEEALDRQRRKAAEDLENEIRKTEDEVCWALQFSLRRSSH